MSRTKCPVQGGMNVRAYPLLWRAVEEGVDMAGCVRTNTDTPEVNTVEQHIVDAVLGEICEYFDFSGDVV